MNSAIHNLPRHLRIGLLGAFVSALAFGLVWTTAAVGGAPGTLVVVSRILGPNPTAMALIEGLCWAGLIGSLIFFTFSIVYGFTWGRRRRR